MKVAANQSHVWITKYEDEAEINLTHSTAALFSYEEILELQGGPGEFISKIKDEKVSYGQVHGSINLRKKIASIYGDNISWKSILVTNGCSNANFLAFYTFLEPGDEVIIITPNWWPILATPSSFGPRTSWSGLEWE